MPVYNEKNKAKWTKDGRHYYFRCYYTNKNGKRKAKWSKMYKTSKEAEIAEAKFLLKYQTTVEIDTSILFDTVYVEWLEIRKRVLKPSTYYGKKHKCDKYILPFFTGSKLKNIHTPQITSWYEEFWKNTNSIEYNNIIIGYMYDLFSYARDNYDIDNKLLGKLQKQKDYEVKDKPKDSEINFWTLEEYNTFIQYPTNKLDKLIYKFLYKTGLREGEMIALTWEDINFQTKELRINKSFTNKCEEVIYIITDPKTKNSIRIIDLDDDIFDELMRHYEEEKKIYGFNHKMFIFGNVKYIAPTTFARHLDDVINNVRKDIPNFKRITPHGFRHSHVSLLIYLGCDSKEVAERIGDTVQVVERTYYHMFPKKKSHTVGVLNELNM